MRISIVTALLLTGCGDDQLDDRRGELGVVVPKPGAFSAGKWTGELASDHTGEELRLFVGITRKADAYEVVLEIGSGGAKSFPARQEGATLVVEEASLVDGNGCGWSHLDFERITFRREGDRLLGEGTFSWERFEDDYFTEPRQGAASFTASSTVEKPSVWNQADSVFHSPPGRFATVVDEAVLLPDEVTIDLRGDRFSGAVERAGTWGRNIRIVPGRALPWGSSAVVHADVVDAAGLAHALSFELPTVAAPTAAPDPLLSTLDGYATAGIRSLSAATASALLDRDIGFVLDHEVGWVLAFEAEVPDEPSPRLEIDLVGAIGDGIGTRSPEPVVVTIATATSSPVELTPLFEGSNDRELDEVSEFVSVVDVALSVDLSGFRGEGIYISLSGAPNPLVCAPWDEVGALTVALKRVEILP